MKRVSGIGGIFFKARDPKALQAWYGEHLGLEISEWGGAMFKSGKGDEVTVWNVFPESTTYFAPSSASFMINYRVDDLAQLVEALRSEGCQVDERGIEASEYGKFAWVMDPEGNRVELWEPPAE